MTNPPRVTALFSPSHDAVMVFGLSPMLATMEIPHDLAKELHAALTRALAAPELAKRQADMFHSFDVQLVELTPLEQARDDLRWAQRTIVQAQEDAASTIANDRPDILITRCLRAAALCQWAAQSAQDHAALQSIAKEEPLP